MGYFHIEKAALVAPQRGQYPHRFGGPIRHRLVGDGSDSLNVHCLYLFATADPAIPNVLPEREFLPLYYPLFNNACDFAYQVVSDEEVRIHLVSDVAYDDFPYEEFPDILSEHPVSARQLTYDEQKTLVYAFTARDCLNNKAISESDRKFLTKNGYPFTQLGGIQYMTQGVPEQKCPNPDCEYADFSNMHDVFAVVWNNPIPGFQIWGEYGDYSQIIFQICPKCPTIHVCNRCD